MNLDQISEFSKNLRGKTKCNEVDVQEFWNLCAAISKPNEQDYKISLFLLCKTNDYIISMFQNPLSYLNKLDESKPLFLILKLSGLKSFVKNNEMAASLSTELIENINSIMNGSYHRFESRETSLHLINLLKSILKKNTLQQVNDKLKNHFFNNFIEFTKFHMKSLSIDLDSETIYDQIYSLSKLFKCIDIFLKAMEPSEEKNAYSDYLMTKLANSELFTKNSLQLKEIFTSDLNIIFNSFYAKLLIILCNIYFSLNKENLLLYKDIINKTIFTNETFNFDLIYTRLDDDVIIDFNLTCLVKQMTLNDSELFEFELNSHVLFVKLLGSISFDHEILLDWLITNETKFLIYLVKYLKLLNHELRSDRDNLLEIFSKKNENKFISCYESLDQKKHVNTPIGEFYLKNSFKTLINLNKKIKKLKRSFPYNCAPLIKLLDLFVELAN